MKLPHTIRGRRCELRPPRKVSDEQAGCDDRCCDVVNV